MTSCGVRSGFAQICGQRRFVAGHAARVRNSVRVVSKLAVAARKAQAVRTRTVQDYPKKDSPGQQLPSDEATDDSRYATKVANEVICGRTAMLGFLACLIGELLTGKGALAQLGYDIAAPNHELDWLVLFVIGFNLVNVALPTENRLSEQLKSQQPAAEEAALARMLKFVGINGFGFTMENELFVGRVAQLGISAALIGELLTGKGPLAQIGFETGLPLHETEFGGLAFIAFFIMSVFNQNRHEADDAASDDDSGSEAF